MKKKKTGLIITIILLVLCLGAIVIGLTYAWFQTSEEGSTNVIEVAEGLSLELINEDIVSITDTMPMTDAWAIENIESYLFTLSNSGSATYNYSLGVEHIETILPVSVLKYAISVDNGQTWTTPESLTNFNYIGTITGLSEIDFMLKLWVDKETTTDHAGQKYEGKITVNAVNTSINTTMTYNLTSSNTVLSTRTISVPAKETTKIDVEVVSDNTEDTKYQLTYSLRSGNALVSTTSENATGTITANEIEEVNLVVENTGSRQALVEIELSGATPEEELKIPEESMEIRRYNASSNKNIIVDLTSGMVPIKWDGTKWVKADQTNSNNDWYNYDEFKWANMALVNNETLYTAPTNTEVPMANILAMYVYIPRYRYKLWNVSNTSNDEQEIEIIFETKATAKSLGATNGEYLTHPAFTFGSDELNGIWVGKFEISSGPKMVPNVISLKSTSIKNFFTHSQTFKSYGLTNTTVDAHMIKSMEWGAVAYLSHSKYGKYGNPAYEGANKEIFMNNYYNGGTYTGCSAGVPGAGTPSKVTKCVYTYEVENSGTGASTTGTIYGIYDMSGGAWDFVMGNVTNSSGNFSSGNSGFTSPYPDTKYYTSYKYGSSHTDHARGNLGDATKETLKTFGDANGGWYGDYAELVYNGSAWMRRGGTANGLWKGLGIFNFDSDDGGSDSESSSRAVIVNIN